MVPLPCSSITVSSTALLRRRREALPESYRALLRCDTPDRRENFCVRRLASLARSILTEPPHKHDDGDRLEIDALARNIRTTFQQVVSLSPLLSDDLQTLAMNIAEPARLADFIASSLSTISTSVKQEVLETLDIRARMDNLNRILIKKRPKSSNSAPRFSRRCSPKSARVSANTSCASK